MSIIKTHSLRRGFCGSVLVILLSQCGSSSPDDSVAGAGAFAAGAAGAAAPGGGSNLAGSNAAGAAEGGRVADGGSSAAGGGAIVAGFNGVSGGGNGGDVALGGSSPGGGGAGIGGAGNGGTSGPDNAAYACTLMIGITATEEWYDAGFEKLVDNSRWELIYVHSGFVELWADAKDSVWSTAVLSPCAQDASKPDRVIFVALNFDFTTLDQWLPPMTAAVKNLRAKYTSAKRIELMSFIRAPGDQPCAQAPAKRSTITPAQDEAMARVAAANPGIVVLAPKFEAKTCAEFSSNPPHPSSSGATAWSKMVAAYYH